MEKKNILSLPTASTDMTAGIDCTGLINSAAAYDTNGTLKVNKLYTALYDVDIHPVFWNGKSYYGVQNPLANKKWNSEQSKYEKNTTTTAFVLGTRTGGIEGDSSATAPTKIPLLDENGNAVMTEDQNGDPIEKKVWTFFRHLVPGDIVWYSGHVMMVSSIAEPTGTDVNGTPYWDDENAVTVIESVFNNGNTEGTTALFGVGKNRNVKMLTLLNHDWEIWRLATK